MATLAGRVGLVKVSAAGSVFTTVGGVDTIDATGFFKADAMDLVQMGDAAGRSASSGFYGSTQITISGKYDPADAGIVILVGNLASCYVQYLPDGTTGFKARVAWDLKLSPKAGGDALGFTATGTISDGAAPTAV